MTGTTPARRAILPAAIAAAATFTALLGAELGLSTTGVFEPAAAAAFALAALIAGISLLLFGRHGESGNPALPAVAALGAAAGAIIFLVVASAGAPGLRPRSVVRTSGDRVLVSSRGRTLPYPTARRDADDALVAASQAASLSRVLVIGGGRPGLVRELLGRGARSVDILEPDPTLAAALEPHLARDDRIALAFQIVRTIHADPLAFLAAREGQPYDLVVIDCPLPTNIWTERFYSEEFHALVASRLGPMGIALVSLPEGIGDGPGPLVAQALNAVEVVYKKETSIVLPDVPGKSCRILAAAGQAPTSTDLELAAKRCTERTMPGGGLAPKVTAESLRPLLDWARAKEITGALRNAPLEARPLVAPTLYLDRMMPAKPGWAARGARLMVMAGLPVFVLALFGCMLAARRTSTSARPGRFAFGVAAAMTGAVLAAGALTVMLAFQAVRGSLIEQLPAFVATLLAGVGLGAAAALRLAGRAQARPRIWLAGLGFITLAVLLVSAMLLPMTGQGAAGAVMLATILLVLGLLAGAELALLAALEPGAPMAAIAMFGVSGGAALVALAVLPAMGPMVAFEMLLGFKLVELGTLGAGAGRR